MLLKNKIYFIGIVLSIFMFLQGCTKTWDDHYNSIDETSQKAKIISELEAIPDISKFTEAVKKIDTLVSILNQNRLYTVFAPTNEAFDAIDSDILNNESQLVRLILNHFIGGKYKYKDFSSSTFTTFNGKNLKISVDASRNVLVNDNSSIVQSDYLSQNGMIQVIDKALIPLNNLYEYFSFNKYSAQFGNDVPYFTQKEFLIEASTPTGIKNDKNKMIYDSVFSYTNPFLYEEFDGISDDIFGYDFSYVNTSDENEKFTFVFPVNYESVLNTLNESSFLNSKIPDYVWAAPILTNFIFNAPIEKDQIIKNIENYHAKPKVDTIPIQIYLADALMNNSSGMEELSNGQVYLIENFQYDMNWLISDQGNNKVLTAEDDYHKTLIANCTYSEKVDTVIRITKQVKATFYKGDDPEGYLSKYGAWINFNLPGSFFLVDYKVLVKGKNTNSGTFKVEANGEEIGEFDFSASASGALDNVFNEIGVISFNKIQSSTNLKFTFVNTHPGVNKLEQFLWIREIKFTPIIK